MATNFKVFLSLTKQPDDGTVYQKQDGERFSASNTIKLNVNTTYTTCVVIRPQRQINKLLIGGEKLELDPVKPDRDDDDSCKYQAAWTSVSYEQSKSGKRKEVPVVIEMGNGITMKVVLQCKFYPETETQHSQWGQPLHNVEYDCDIPEACTFVNITRTKYL